MSFDPNAINIVRYCLVQICSNSVKLNDRNNGQNPANEQMHQLFTLYFHLLNHQTHSISVNYTEASIFLHGTESFFFNLHFHDRVIRNYQGECPHHHPRNITHPTVYSTPHT